MNRYLRQDSVIFALLALVMLVTRPHLLDQYVHLPDTSWASFFVAGYFIRNRLAFPALFTLAFAMDVVTIYLFGGSGFCFTPAYWMLLPAYCTMWLAGRFAAHKFDGKPSSLPAYALLATAAAFVAQCFSSGGFYLLSGHFEAPTFAGFAERLAQYFPGNLLAMFVWLTIAALCHLLWAKAVNEVPNAARQP